MLERKVLALLDIAALFASPIAPHLAAFILPSLILVLTMSFTLRTSPPVCETLRSMWWMQITHCRWTTKIVSGLLFSACLRANLAASPASGRGVRSPI